MGGELACVQLRAGRCAAGVERSSLAFFMYPQAETAEGRMDSLDPENFHYEITSHEVKG